MVCRATNTIARYHTSATSTAPTMDLVGRRALILPVPIVVVVLLQRADCSGVQRRSQFTMFLYYRSSYT